MEVSQIISTVTGILSLLASTGLGLFIFLRKRTDENKKENDTHTSVITVRNIDALEKFQNDLIAQSDKIAAQKDALEIRLTTKIDAMQNKIDELTVWKTSQIDIEANLKRQNHILEGQVADMRESQRETIDLYEQMMREKDGKSREKDRMMKEMEIELQSLKLEVADLHQILNDNGITANE